MSVLGLISVGIIGYVCVAALVHGYVRADARKHCKGGFHCFPHEMGLIVGGAFWPVTIFAYLVVKPWWTRIIVPLAAYAETLFTPKDAA